MNPDILIKRHKELEQRRPEYIKAKRFAIDQMSILQQVSDLVKSFRPGDNGDKAIYLISQVSVLLGPLCDAFATIKHFEASESNYQKLRNSLPRETLEGIQEAN
jgi:hypothetical protein